VDTALSRTSRALDLIPYIVEHPGVHISELAEIFDTSPAEISKELDILFMCGLPGYTHLELVDISQEDGYVSVIDAQNLSRPRALNGLEVTSILLGLQNLKTINSNPKVLEIISSLESKLRHVQPILEAVRVDTSVSLQEQSALNTINAAIGNRGILKFTYRHLTRDEELTYEVTPIELYSLNGNVYLKALSHSVREVRNFRIDAILEISQLPKAQSADTSFIEPELEVTEVLLPPDAIAFLEKHAAIIDDLGLLGNLRHIRIKSGSPDWLLRSLMAIPGNVEILSPVGLKERFFQHNVEALHGYTD
jgi:proteasome accessory factor C